MPHNKWDLSSIVESPPLNLPRRTPDVPAIVRATQGSIMPPPQQGLLARLFTDPSILNVLAQLGGMAVGGGYGGLGAANTMQQQRELARQQSQTAFENTYKRDLLSLDQQRANAEKSRIDLELKRFEQEHEEKRMARLRDAVHDVKQGRLTAEQAASTYELSPKDAVRLQGIKPEKFAVNRNTGEVMPEENVPHTTFPAIPGWSVENTQRSPDFTQPVPESLVGVQALGARSEGRMVKIAIPKEAQEFFGGAEVTIPENQRLEFAKFIRGLTPEKLQLHAAISKQFGPLTPEQTLKFFDALPPQEPQETVASFDPQTGAMTLRQGRGVAQGGLDPFAARQSTQRFNNSTQLIRMIDKLVSIAKPTDLGTVGEAKQFIASAAAQAAALGDKEWLPAFAETQPMTRALSEAIIYKYARTNDPVGVLDIEVVKGARRALGLGDWLSNLPAAKKALLGVVRPEAVIQAQQAAKELEVNWEPPSSAQDTTKVINVEAITDSGELARIAGDQSQPAAVRQQAIDRWKRLKNKK